MKKFFIFALCVSSSLAFAKGYSPALTARAGGYDVKFSPSGQPIAVPAIAAAGGSAAQVAASFQFKWPNGVDAAGAAVSVFTGAKTAGAFGAASAVLGIAALYAIPAIKDWMDLAAVVPMNGGGIGGLPAGADNLDYSINGVWYATKSLACSGFVQNVSDGYAEAGNGYVASVSAQDPRCAYTVTNVRYPGYDYGGDSRAYATRSKILPVAPALITLQAAQALLALPTPTAAAVQALVDLNFPPEAELPVMTGPVSQFKGNVVSLGLDGTVQEIEERYIASFQPGLIQIGIEKKQTVTTPEKKSTSITTNPDGSTAASVITTAKSSSTLTTTGASDSAADKPSITCGLPGTPACKMDETGTSPNAGTTFDAPIAAIDTAKSASDVAIGQAANIATPAWSFTFQLPTGCAPYVTGIKGVILNVCQYQSTIHGLLSAIWAAATAFAMIGMVGRTIREA